MIDLSDSAVDEYGPGELAQATRSAPLFLSGTRAGDISLEDLAPVLPHLEVLHLARTEVGEAGLRHLAAASEPQGAGAVRYEHARRVAADHRRPAQARRARSRPGRASPTRASRRCVRWPRSRRSSLSETAVTDNRGMLAVCAHPLLHRASGSTRPTWVTKACTRWPR